MQLTTDMCMKLRLCWRGRYFRNTDFWTFFNLKRYILQYMWYARFRCPFLPAFGSTILLSVSDSALLYLKAPGFWPFTQSNKSNKKVNMNMLHWRNNTDREKLNCTEETCHNTVLLTTNLNWTGSESNLQLSDDGTVTNNLNNCTVFGCQFPYANPAEIIRIVTKCSVKFSHHTGLCETYSENVILG
jgi:hypothetical protein